MVYKDLCTFGKENPKEDTHNVSKSDYFFNVWLRSENISEVVRLYEYFKEFYYRINEICLF